LFSVVIVAIKAGPLCPVSPSPSGGFVFLIWRSCCIVGYPHDISEDVIDNLPNYHNYGDARDHIRAFMQCIDEWCDPPIYEDVLMQLFVMTFCEEDAYDWFVLHKDNEIKTMRDFLHGFLERFGDDQVLAIRRTLPSSISIYTHTHSLFVVATSVSLSPCLVRPLLLVYQFQI
jgi:hypothetical protein